MCCTPYVATIVAGVLSIFQSFVNLCWNVPLILGLSLNKTETLTLMPVKVTEIENVFVIYGISLLLTLVNLQLLIFSCLLLKANQASKTDWIGAWCILILLKSLINVFLGIYFLYIYGNDHRRRIAFFRLAALFSGIFFFWPAINLIFFTLVFKRYRDISGSGTTILRTEASPQQDDSRPPPYSPGSYEHRQPIDPSSISGWSHQPLLHYDQEESSLSPYN